MPFSAQRFQHVECLLLVPWLAEYLVLVNNNRIGSNNPLVRKMIPHLMCLFMGYPQNIFLRGLILLSRFIDIGRYDGKGYAQRSEDIHPPRRLARKNYRIPFFLFETSFIPIY